MTTILALLGFAALFALAGFFALRFGAVERPDCGGCGEASEACETCPLVAARASASPAGDPGREGGGA